MNIFTRIKELIVGKENEIEQLKRTRSQLQQALDALEEISIVPQDSIFRGIRFKYSADYDEDIIEYLRSGLFEFIEDIGEQIVYIQISIVLLKIKLHYFKRNLRTWIRQMQHFLFKNMDDTHIIFTIKI